MLHAKRRVMSYELDAFGHVNNAVYLQYLEGARMDFMRQKGLSFNDFFRWQRFPVVVRAHLEFKAQARADDNLEINAQITTHTASTFTLQYRLTRCPDGKMVLEAETVHVFIDEKGRPTRIPEPFFSAFIGKKK